MWKIEDGITQSFLRSFLTCKRQCYIQYIEGLVPQKTSIKFLFGSMSHYIISESIKQKRPYLFPEEIQKLIDEYKIPEYDLYSEDEHKELRRIFSLLKVMMPSYMAYYGPDFRRDWVLNETLFDTVFEDIRLRGRIDGGYIENERLWITDTKCFSTFDEDVIYSTMPFDLQCMFYLTAGSTLYNRIGGFVYNIIRKPQHKIKKDESNNDFEQRLAAEIGKNPKHFFTRIVYEPHMKELTNWQLSFLHQIYEEIIAWKKSGFVSPINPLNLITKYGKCAYFDIITHNNRRNYVKKSTVFPELEENEYPITN